MENILSVEHRTLWILPHNGNTIKKGAHLTVHYKFSYVLSGTNKVRKKFSSFDSKNHWIILQVLECIVSIFILFYFILLYCNSFIVRSTKALFNEFIETSFFPLSCVYSIIIKNGFFVLSFEKKKMEFPFMYVVARRKLNINK